MNSRRNDVTSHCRVAQAKPHQHQLRLICRKTHSCQKRHAEYNGLISFLLVTHSLVCIQWRHVKCTAFSEGYYLLNRGLNRHSKRVRKGVDCNQQLLWLCVIQYQKVFKLRISRREMQKFVQSLLSKKYHHDFRSFSVEELNIFKIMEFKQKISP